MMGRPTKLTPKVQERIGKAIEDGLPYETAARLAGVSYDSFNRWLHDGEAGIEPYCKFYKHIKECEAKGEEELLNRIKETGASGKAWQANAWILERRYPERYAKSEKLQVDQKTELKAQGGITIYVPDNKRKGTEKEES